MQTSSQKTKQVTRRKSTKPLDPSQTTLNLKSEKSTPAKETSIVETGLRRKLEFTDPQSTTFGLSEQATNVALPYDITPTIFDEN